MFVDEIRRHKQKALIPSPLYENEQNKWEISQWILLRERERERECVFLLCMCLIMRGERRVKEGGMYIYVMAAMPFPAMISLLVVVQVKEEVQ